MALIHSLESSGNYLFRYRGQIPVILFVMAIPFVYITPVEEMNDNLKFATRILAVFLSVFGFYIRMVTIGTTPKGTSGRNTKQQVAEELNSTGIYSVVRHPLYLGNYFMWIGIVLYTFNIFFVVIVSLLYWLYYERIMFAEERFLERKFGDKYLEWSKKVPAFLPNMKIYQKGTIPFSLKTVLRREYSGFLATVLGFLYVDLLRDYFTNGRLDWNSAYIIVGGTAVFITIVLRTLKHKTRLLHEEDRS